MTSKRQRTKKWLQRHRSDSFVRAAQTAGYRSRAVYKLSEIQDKDRILKPGMAVVDLGAAPGGWSQYCAQTLAGNGSIVAIDLLAMEPIEGVRFLQADFAEQAGLDALCNMLGDAPVDLVLSDMAPNLSGITVADQMRAMHLAELALDFCGQVLKPGGDALVKVFQGEGFDDLLGQFRQRFKQVKVRKPRASRDASRENYLLGRGWRP